ncbi:MAG: ATP-binding protein [Pseudomonadota bacterium]
MDRDELQKLIEKGETHTVEFKESLGLIDEIGEEISALSNSNGGTTLVGVTDNREIIGVQTGKKTLEDLANYIKTHTDNHVFPKVSVADIDGKTVISIEVIVNAITFWTNGVSI